PPTKPARWSGCRLLLAATSSSCRARCCPLTRSAVHQPTRSLERATIVERKLASLEAVEFKLDEARKGFFSGYASVFGGVDSYGDTILPGAYKKTLKHRRRPVQMRWNHYGPVIGKWLKL